MASDRGEPNLCSERADTGGEEGRGEGEGKAELRSCSFEDTVKELEMWPGFPVLEIFTLDSPRSGSPFVKRARRLIMIS